MDLTDDKTRKTVEKSITDKVSAIDKSLSKYKSNTEFKTLLANYNRFIKAKDTFCGMCCYNSYSFYGDNKVNYCTC
jgi:methyl-accepting chemotaxis protein